MNTKHRKHKKMTREEYAEYHASPEDFAEELRSQRRRQRWTDADKDDEDYDELVNLTEESEEDEE